MINHEPTKLETLKNKLHISEVKFSDLRNTSMVDRLDSEFFDKEILEYMEVINLKSFDKFEDLIDVLTDYTSNGSFGDLAKNVNVVDEPSYAKWIRIMNLDRSDYINDVRWVDKDGYDYLKKSSLKNGDLLISKTGEYLGKSYIFYNFNDEKCTLADNIFLLRLKNPLIEPYVYIYIRTKIGRKLLLRWSQGTGQPTIIKDSLRQLVVPRFSEDFYSLIKKLVDHRFALLSDSKKIYDKMLNELTREVGFDVNLTFENVNELKFSDSYGKTFRFDSEYYQKKFVYLSDVLSKNTCKKLSGDDGLCDIYKSIEPGSDYYCESGVPFIRVQDLSQYCVDEPKVYLDEETCKDVRKPKKDDILLSKDASIGIAYRLYEDSNFVTSGAILSLIVKNQEIVRPSYLALLLNSPIVRMQAERDSGGSIMKHWKPTQIADVDIPLLSIERQLYYENNCDKSFHDYNLAERILNKLEEAVEMAIKNDEKTAVNFLKKEFEFLS